MPEARDRSFLPFVNICSIRDLSKRLIKSCHWCYRTEWAKVLGKRSVKSSARAVGNTKTDNFLHRGKKTAWVLFAFSGCSSWAARRKKSLLSFVVVEDLPPPPLPRQHTPQTPRTLVWRFEEEWIGIPCHPAFTLTVRTCLDLGFHMKLRCGPEITSCTRVVYRNLA